MRFSRLFPRSFAAGDQRAKEIEQVDRRDVEFPDQARSKSEDDKNEEAEDESEFQNRFRFTRERLSLEQTNEEAQEGDALQERDEMIEGRQSARKTRQPGRAELLQKSIGHARAPLARPPGKRLCRRKAGSREFGPRPAGGSFHPVFLKVAFEIFRQQRVDRVSFPLPVRKNCQPQKRRMMRRTGERSAFPIAISQR